MSKGIELPVSVIVIISLAILVLLAVGTFFIQNVGKEEASINTQAAFSQACIMLRSAGCEADITKLEVPYGNSRKEFIEICDLQGLAADKCAEFCGCELDAPFNEVVLNG